MKEQDEEEEFGGKLSNSTQTLVGCGKTLAQPLFLGNLIEAVKNLIYISCARAEDVPQTYSLSLSSSSPPSF